AEEAFRISGNEDHGDLERIEDIFDSLQSGAAIGELNIRDNEAGPIDSRHRNRLRSGACNPDAAVTETFDETLEIESDQSFVLDDQNIGGDLCRKLASG